MQPTNQNTFTTNGFIRKFIHRKIGLGALFHSSKISPQNSYTHMQESKPLHDEEVTPNLPHEK
jgi:hypothetical protein